VLLSVSLYGGQEDNDMTNTPTVELERRRSILREELAKVGDFRLGSLIYRYRRCGKTGCLCANPKHPGHGVWVISKKVRGKTVMSTVPHHEDLALVRGQLDESRRFWKLTEEFAEASDELSRRRLAEAGAEATAKKGASRRRARRRSPRR
jgi:hypothetical protein